MHGYLSVDIRCSFQTLSAHSFPRASLSENFSRLGTDNVRGQISEHIFATNGGSCLYILQTDYYVWCARLFRNDCSRFGGIPLGAFSKTIIPLAIGGYEIIRANEARNAELAIYHLLSKAHSWNNLLSIPFQWRFKLLARKMFPVRSPKNFGPLGLQIFIHKMGWGRRGRVGPTPLPAIAFVEISVRLFICQFTWFVYTDRPTFIDNSRQQLTAKENQRTAIENHLTGKKYLEYYWYFCLFASS